MGTPYLKINGHLLLPCQPHPEHDEGETQGQQVHEGLHPHDEVVTSVWVFTPHVQGLHLQGLHLHCAVIVGAESEDMERRKKTAKCARIKHKANFAGKKSQIRFDSF